MSLTPKEALDVSKIFLSYLATGGDVVATAKSSGCSVSDVAHLATTELWDSKMSEVGVTRGETFNDAKEKTIIVNRVGCYIQALRIKALIDATLKWCYDDKTNVMAFNSEKDKMGNSHFSTKPLLDLAKAAETCQGMLYRSLGDDVGKGSPGSGNTGGMRQLQAVHAQVTEAMSSLPAGQIPEHLLQPLKDLAGVDLAEKQIKKTLPMPDPFSL